MISHTESVANQMMKGPRHGRFAKNTTPESRKMFTAKYRPLIEDMTARLPRVSAPVCAVVCKCALKYGVDKAGAFAEALRNGTFTGPLDPVHHFWLYLKRNDDSTIVVYKKTVTAVRAYCEGRTITRIRPAIEDIEIDLQVEEKPIGESENVAE